MIFVYATTLVLLLFYALLIRYYHRGWKAQPEHHTPPAQQWQPHTPLTLLVPARNESARIRSCLDSITAQDYPGELLELIVIDDHSEDDTAAIVRGYADKGVRLISLREELAGQEVNSYKKKAIETGISRSAGKLIVTTDADCTAGRNWLRSIAYCHENSRAELVAGPVLMRLQRGWLSVFQTLDFFSLQGITAASVFRGFHSMCNGANLAYTRKAFDAVNGFSQIDGIASGDDMLLMHKIAKAYPGGIRYLPDREAIVTTGPEPTVGAFLRQRIRWASKAKWYDDKSVFLVLLLVYLMNLLLLVCLPMAFFSFDHALACLSLYLLKTATEWPFMKSVAGFYGHPALMRYFPLFQPVHILYTVAAGSFGQFGKYEWKGRKVR